MCAALIGGMSRLKREYAEAAKALGVTLKVFDGNESYIADRIGQTECLILFTGKLSHKARSEAMRHAVRNGIPVRQCHSSGISSLRQCLNDITNNR
ncbi:DUF2325 domain-containing protein [Desulfocurvibacter africanus]|uniref:DUF2325 domain-containing protein n=2 Tax=Desulfocurvibacter africanus TaxID=873 RepID=F3YTP0_DESAF|nr:DUF2325 domain-containing protein [Desulfocurvibacter africanus]EGJ49300.1 hypothetical protein Desaf_0952 [Desulfocurvibacter africanus subsp. africanus str. Walvis Bay]EMG37396.1 hypothetical protein PCS_01909 [Desulfocurvibacter africanus PCS]